MNAKYQGMVERIGRKLGREEKDLCIITVGLMRNLTMMTDGALRAENGASQFILYYGTQKVGTCELGLGDQKYCDNQM